MEIIYKCSLCGKQSSLRENIEDCESSHISKKKIKIDSIGWSDNSNSFAPDYITVDIDYVKYEYQRVKSQEY